MVECRHFEEVEVARQIDQAQIPEDNFGKVGFEEELDFGEVERMDLDLDLIQKRLVGNRPDRRSLGRRLEVLRFEGGCSLGRSIREEHLQEVHWKVGEGQLMRDWGCLS